MRFREIQKRHVIPIFIGLLAGCTVAFPIDDDSSNDTGDDTDTSPLMGSDDDSADGFSDMQTDPSTYPDSNTDTDRSLAPLTDQGVGTEIETTPRDSETEPGTGTDLCPGDPNKEEPGICGCGVPDDDSDKDGTADCVDKCPQDPQKTKRGQCGCGHPDTDSDKDGTADCKDGCPSDPNKADPGECGCNQEEGTCSLDPRGTYRRLPVENNWHIGDIERDGVNYRWSNAAGIDWVLIPDLDNYQLFTQADCPYDNAPGGDRFILVMDGDTITGFEFQYELYSKQK